MNREKTHKLSVPRDLYEKIGNQEKTIKIIKTGLLSLRVTSLEREIADLIGKIEDSKRRITELPGESDKLEEILREAIKDQKTLENLLDKGK